MKAIEVQNFGNTEVLQIAEREVPPIGPNSVLVRVKAAGVNPGDARIRRGEFEPFARHFFPIVLGWEAAGTVEAIGFSDSRFEVGDEVFGIFRHDYIGDGAYAEMAVVDDRQLVKRPVGLSPISAAGLAVAGSTAYGMVHTLAQVGADDVVVVNGAAGGVGHFCVQLAALTGARVIGLTRMQNEQFVLGLGAHEVVDYSTGEAAAVISRRYPSGVDVYLDTVGGTMQDLGTEILHREGRFASCVQPPGGPTFDEKAIDARFQFLQPDRAVLEALASLAAAEQLRVHVSDVFELENAAQAHERIDSGHTRGKIVLTVGP